MAVLITDIDHKFLRESGKGAVPVGNRLSESVWGGIPVGAWSSGVAAGPKGSGIFHFDDFAPYDPSAYDVVVDTGATVAPSVVGDTGFGVGLLKLAVDASGADEQAGLAANGAMIKFTAGKSSAFECRVAIDQTAETNFFAGVVEEGYAVDELFHADANARGTEDQVGFSVDVTSGAAIADVVYGTTPTVHLEGAQTMVADTFYQFGFNCNGTDIVFYVDGKQVGTALAVASLPTAVQMTPVVEIKMNGANAGNAYVDWIACAHQN